jgi:hypothetical protein
LFPVKKIQCKQLKQQTINIKLKTENERMAGLDGRFMMRPADPDYWPAP